MYQYISLRKYLFVHREFESRYKYSKDPLSERDKRFYIGSRKEIHYRNIDSISRFIGLAGRIIPRRVTKITLRHQRLMTSAIKKARFLALLPFIENELHFKKKWQDILARRKKRKDEKKNKKKRRSIFKTNPKREPRVPPLGTETDHPNPLRGLRGRGTSPDSSGFKTNPKREPRVPPLATKPGTSPFKNEGFKTNPKTESSSSRNRTRD
uniref:Small ribosomal subunit protein bS18c n=1 Tax=Carex cinerascens TaxID=2753223 RepID=A0AAU7AM00_9POAL